MYSLSGQVHITQYSCNEALPKTLTNHIFKLGFAHRIGHAEGDPLLHRMSRVLRKALLLSPASSSSPYRPVAPHPHPTTTLDRRIMVLKASTATLPPPSTHLADYVSLHCRPLFGKRTKLNNVRWHIKIYTNCCVHLLNVALSVIFAFAFAATAAAAARWLGGEGVSPSRKRNEMKCMKFGS